MEINRSFAWKSVAGVSALVHERWAGLGIVHGFFGQELGLSKETQSEKLKELQAALSLEQFVVPEQVHGRGCVVVGEHPTRQGDAVVTRRRSVEKCAVGVITADCVPILFHSSERVGAIHAGWRGLAAGVIENTLQQCAGSYTNLEFLIGPCAGAERYEVGREVLDQIGATAVCSKREAGLFLDLAQTAARQIRAIVGEGVKIERCEMDTISTPLFHSYRRDGTGCGRNLSFICG